jgi:nitric oxide reductase subunit C
MAGSAKRWILGSLCAAFAVYSLYVYTAGTESAPGRPLTPSVKAGLDLFQQKNCVACHQFYGLGGYMGPDLTNVVSDPDKGGVYARSFLESGTSRMPDYGFSESEIDDLIQFLEFVDATGQYPPKQPELRWYGTVAYDADR